jgi:hypothetical protein
MKKYILFFLILTLAFACTGFLASAYDGETYEDTLALGYDGEYHCNVPYGYTWEVDYIDGYIVGEDVTICTTVEAYERCNPKWAITNILEKQQDGTYVAVRRPIVGEGTVPKIQLGENQVAFVVHSGGSVPQNCLGSYENWVGKVVACSIRKGDVFEVDLDSEIMTVYANGQHVEPVSESSAADLQESSEETVASAPEESSPDTESVPSADESNAPEESKDDHTVLIVCIALAVVVTGVVVVIVARRKK